MLMWDGYPCLHHPGQNHFDGELSSFDCLWCCRDAEFVIQVKSLPTVEENLKGTSSLSPSQFLVLPLHSLLGDLTPEVLDRLSEPEKSGVKDAVKNFDLLNLKDKNASFDWSTCVVFSRFITWCWVIFGYYDDDNHRCVCYVRRSYVTAPFFFFANQQPYINNLCPPPPLFPSFTVRVSVVFRSIIVFLLFL